MEGKARFETCRKKIEEILSMPLKFLRVFFVRKIIMEKYIIIIYATELTFKIFT